MHPYTSNKSKAFRAGILGLFLILGSVTASPAQNEKVRFNRSRLSVEQAIRSIQEQTKYVFAFDIRTLDISRTVTFENRTYSITDALEQLTAEAGHSYLISGRYIVINSTPKEKSGPELVVVQRTSDTYRPNSPNHQPELNPDQTVPAPVSKTETETPPVPAPADSVAEPPAAYYSAYNDPDLYGPMRNKLPNTSIKTNLLYGAAALAPNLGIEIGTSRRNSLEIWGSYNGWEHGSKDTKQLQHFIVRPEFRWWMCERYNGHFVGVNAMYAHYQVSGKKIPMLFKKGNRYDGDAYGVGFTYGYQLPLGKKWGFEFNVGVGAVYLHYDRYTCEACDRQAVKKDKFYFGPTRAGVSLVFMIK